MDSVVARNALSLLGRLFRYGEIYHHGAVVDVVSSRAVPLAVDSWVWRRIRKGGGTARALAQRLNPGA